jgi:hypothetical protein
MDETDKRGAPGNTRRSDELGRAATERTSKTSGILAALRRSPLVGADLNLTRSNEAGRDNVGNGPFRIARLFVQTIKALVIVGLATMLSFAAWAPALSDPLGEQRMPLEQAAPNPAILESLHSSLKIGMTAEEARAVFAASGVRYFTLSFAACHESTQSACGRTSDDKNFEFQTSIDDTHGLDARQPVVTASIRADVVSDVTLGPLHRDP